MGLRSSRRVSHLGELLHDAFDQLGDACLDRGCSLQAQLDRLGHDADDHDALGVPVEQTCPGKQVGDPNLVRRKPLVLVLNLQPQPQELLRLKPPFRQ